MRSGSGPAAGRGAFAPPPLPPPWAEGRGGSGGWEVSGSRLGAPRMERAMEQLNRLTRSLRRARTVELPDGRRGVAGRWPGGPSRGRGGLPGPARPGLARPSRPAGVSWAAGRCVAPAPTVRRLGKWKPAPFPLPPPGGFFLFVTVITTAATASPASSFPRCLAAGGRRCLSQGGGCPCPLLPPLCPGEQVVWGAEPSLSGFI